MAFGIYDVDGKVRLTQSPGVGFVGRYAPDGSIYFTTAPGSGFCGSTAPDGSMYIVDATGSTTIGVYAPNGAIRVTTGNEYNGAWRVSGVSSVVASWDASTSTLALLAAITTHTRASLATMFDSTGKLTYAPNNLLTQSNTFSNAAWTKASATITTGVLDRSGGTSASTLTATGAFANLYAFAATSSSHNVIQSIWIRRRTGTGKIWMKIASSGALFEITGQVTSSWTQVSISGAANASSTPNFLQLDTSGDAVDISEAGVSAVTYETTPRTADQVITTSAAYYGPRIDYDPNTLAVKGLLIEEARTNLALQSNDLMTGSWPVSGVSKSTDGTLGPDGKSLMVKLSATAAGGSHELYQSFSVTSGIAYASSIFVKKGNHRYVAISFEVTGGSNGYLAVFDLDNPSAPTQTFATGVGSLSTSGIVNCGGGIYRIYVSGTVAMSGTGYILAHLVSGATIPTTTVEPTNFVAAGTEYGYFFGAQLEAGSFATSYIPTAAASVTRAADIVQFTGAALTALQGSAATFIGQTIGLPFNPAANSALVAATAGNSVIAYVTNSNAVGVAAAATYNGAAALTVGTPNYATTMRIGSAFSGSGRSLVVNGGSVATDANAIGSRPAVYLGGTGASLYLNGWMQSFAIYNQRLSDATLQAKSVVGASY